MKRKIVLTWECKTEFKALKKREKILLNSKLKKNDLLYCMASLYSVLYIHI